VDVLIRDYCREPGVRSLEKCTRKIVEKIAFRIINNIEEGKNVGEEIVIKTKDLVTILGQPKFSDFKYKNLPPGVVIGLAYTEYGGSLLYLEVTQSRFLPVGH
jgi:ATP-dependent Lon protease